MFWANRNALVIADLHLGKATHFRKNGIAIPQSVELENFERLSTLILQHEPVSVLILGDLFHSDKNDQWSVFEMFLNKFSEVKFHLIMGNHDILEIDNYTHKNLFVHKENLKWGQIVMTHHPITVKGYYNLCGHIHPGVKITGRGRQSLRLSCFYFGKNQGILPAFGAFTGLYVMDIKPEDTVYGIVDDSVVKLK